MTQLQSLRLLYLPLALATAFACGSAPAVPIESTVFAQNLGVSLPDSTKLPSGMYIRDAVVGAGAEAKAGRGVTMKYSGWLADGTAFDANQNEGIRFVLGSGQVIAGWDQGIVGMKVGGTRQLIIPPQLAYGSEGRGPIPSNAVLVFSVTMVSTP
jgi:FKBP-type peptidyl-prolyl cis-trans isomerase FkpA